MHYGWLNLAAVFSKGAVALKHIDRQRSGYLYYGTHR
jgi:hypothetical protein